MPLKRILGIAAIIVGLILFATAQYIKSRIAAGEEVISSAQGSVDRMSRLFSLNPVSKEVGRGITSSAKKQIEQGEQTISSYSVLAGRLQIGGILLTAAGIVLLFLSRKRTK